MEVIRNMTIDTELFVLGDIISFTLSTREKVNKDRLGDFVRTCTDKEMDGVNAGILCSLGIAAPMDESEPANRSITVERNLYKHLYEDLLNKVMTR